MAKTTKRTPLNAVQRQAQKNLRSIWDEKAKALGLTQEKVGAEFGRGQSLINQYLNGTIALNLNAILIFARVLHVSPKEISTEITKDIHYGIPAATKPDGSLSASSLGPRPSTSVPLDPGHKRLLDKFRAALQDGIVTPEAMKIIEMILDAQPQKCRPTPGRNRKRAND